MTRAWVIAAVLATSPPIHADIPANVVGNPNVVGADHPIVITTPGDRSPRDVQLVAGIAGIGLVLTGLGVFYHLDSRSTSNTINAGGPIGEPWTDADQAQDDHAHSLAVKAEVFYGIGGAVLIGALVMWFVTAPDEQRVVIQPRVAPTVTPTPGGALLGGAWRF